MQIEGDILCKILKIADFLGWTWEAAKKGNTSPILA